MGCGFVYWLLVGALWFVIDCCSVFRYLFSFAGDTFCWWVVLMLITCLVVCWVFLCFCFLCLIVNSVGNAFFF